MCGSCIFPAQAAAGSEEGAEDTLHAGSACGISEEVVMVMPRGKDRTSRSRGPGTMIGPRKGLHKACGADDLG